MTTEPNKKTPDRCPGCQDMGVYLDFDMFGERRWVAKGWKDEDDERFEQPIDFCPFCGFELPLGDEAPP